MAHRVSIVAHRGDSGAYPENTLLALRKALEVGVDMIEVDVHLTKDRGLVLIHDPTVNRTSNGRGKVCDLTFAEIRKLDAGSWMSPQFAVERMPTLAEAVAVVPRDVRLNVHVKAYDHDRAVLARLVVDELVARNRLDTAFIASDIETVHEVRRRNPAVALCNLTRADSPDYVQASKAAGCRVLQPGRTGCTRALVEEAHREGMEVNVFYADTVEDMQKFIALGVDGILTNYPARLKHLLAVERSH